MDERDDEDNTMVRGVRWLILMKVRLSRDLSWWLFVMILKVMRMMMKLMVVMIIMIMVMTMMRGVRWLILMKVRLSRDFSWWRNAFRWQRTQATLLLISYSDHARKGSTGSCLIESNLFKAAGNFDRIIEIGSFDSPLLDLFDQKQVLGQIWKKSTAAVNAVNKDGDLVWPQCQGGRKYKFQCQQIKINCQPRKSRWFL